MWKWSRVTCKGFFRMTTLWFDKFFNSVIGFVMKTSRLSLKWLPRLQILIQLMHSNLELLFFIKKHLFLTICNNCCRIHFRACQIIEIQYSTSFEPGVTSSPMVWPEAASSGLWDDWPDLSWPWGQGKWFYTSFQIFTSLYFSPMIGGCSNANSLLAWCP
jgi:hypothetical protein